MVLLSFCRVVYGELGVSMTLLDCQDYIHIWSGPFPFLFHPHLFYFNVSFVPHMLRCKFLECREICKRLRHFINHAAHTYSRGQKISSLTFTQFSNNIVSKPINLTYNMFSVKSFYLFKKARNKLFFRSIFLYSLNNKNTN